MILKKYYYYFIDNSTRTIGGPNPSYLFPFSTDFVWISCARMEKEERAGDVRVINKKKCCVPFKFSKEEENLNSEY